MSRSSCLLVWMIALVGCGDPPSFEPGDPLPPSLVETLDVHSAPAAGVQVAWLFEPDDCLDCQSVARTFRRLMRERAGEVSLFLVSGSPPANFVREFLVRERIDALPLSSWSGPSDEPLSPQVLVVQGGAVSAVFPAGPGSDLDGLDEELDRLLLTDYVQSGRD